MGYNVVMVWKAVSSIFLRLRQSRVYLSEIFLQIIALRYAILAGLLIMAVDLISDTLAANQLWFFVLHAGLIVLTVLVLFFLLRRELVARYQAEAGRYASEARLAHILSTATDAIIATDQALRIQVFNQGAERIFGYEADEVLGQMVDILIPARFVEEYRQLFGEFLASSELSQQMHRQREVFARRKNRTEFPAEVSVSKFTQDGHITLTMIVRDITIRQQALEALRWAHDDLEKKIQERTVELSKANMALQAEVRERERAEIEQARLLVQVEQERRRVSELVAILEKERDLLQTIMEHTWTQLAYLDPDFNFVRVNSAYALGSGHSREELVGRNHFDWFPDAENQAIFEQVRDTRQAVEFRAKPFEYTDQPERGTTYWDWTLVPVVDGTGKVQGLVFSLLDVTQRRRAEEALKQAYDELELRVQQRTQALAKANAELRIEVAERRQIERQLRVQTTALEAAASGIIITDAGGNIRWANPAFMAMTGYPMEEIIGYNPSFLKSGRHLSSDYRQLWQTILAGQVWHGEMINRRKDGSLYHEDQTITPVLDEQGKISHFIAIKQDITERVQAYQLLEQRVEERTRELSTLLDLSGHVALTLELEPRLLLILDRLQAVVDYQCATVYGLAEGRLTVLVRRSPDWQESGTRAPRPLDLSPLEQKVVYDQKPVIIRDTQADTLLAQAFKVAAQKWVGGMCQSTRCWLGLPLCIEDRVVGMLELQHDEPERYARPQIELAQAFANQAAVAIENHRLYEQAQELAALEERHRLARDLHDAVSQTLFSASLAAEVLPVLWKNQPDQGELCLTELQHLTKGALAEMRALLLELRPAVLAESNLGDLLRQLVSAIVSRIRLPVKLNIETPPVLPAEVQVALYRVAQEALNNIVKHAQASQVEITLVYQPLAGATSGGKARLELRICDNGRGFDPGSVELNHFGLGIMRERAEAIGAVFEVSSRPGHGTEIAVMWPATV
ncbi:MAG: PAS domain S-box protein [Chloroflexota bacterium]